MDRPSVRDRAWQNTVGILVRRDDGKIGLGSGFCVGPNLVLTAAHVIENLSAVRVVHPFFRQTADAEEYYRSESVDLALLRVQGHPFRNVPFLSYAEERDTQQRSAGNDVIAPDIVRRGSWSFDWAETLRLKWLSPAFRKGKMTNSEMAFHLPCISGNSGSAIVHADTGEILSVGVWGYSPRYHRIKLPLLPLDIGHSYYSECCGPRPSQIKEFIQKGARYLDAKPVGV